MPEHGSESENPAIPSPTPEVPVIAIVPAPALTNVPPEL